MRCIRTNSLLIILLAAAACSTTSSSIESGDDPVEQESQAVQQEAGSEDELQEHDSAETSETSGGMGMKGSGGGDGFGRVSGLTASRESAAQPTSRIGEVRSEQDDLDEFLAVLEGRANAFTHCYERELQQTPELAGTIQLNWKIDAAGVVESVVVANSTVGSETVERCFTRVAGSTNFDDVGVGERFEVLTVFELTR